MDQKQLALLERRNHAASTAYEQAIAPARLALRNPARTPYPVAVRAALAAYDEVIAAYRPRIWPDG